MRKRDEAIPVNIENAQARAVWGYLYLFKDTEEFKADPVILGKILKAADGFDLIGTMERFDGVVQEMFHSFGIEAVPNIPMLQVGDVNVSKHSNRERVIREPITPEINAELDKLTVYDRPLYKHVLARIKARSKGTK